MYLSPVCSCKLTLEKVLKSTGHTVDVAETSILIFASFLASKIAKNHAILLDNAFVSLVAISSILLSCKIYSSSPNLTMVRHSPFQPLI